MANTACRKRRGEPTIDAIETLRGNYLVIYLPWRRLVSVRLTYDDATGEDDVFITVDATANNYLDVARQWVVQWELSTVVIDAVVTEKPELTTEVLANLLGPGGRLHHINNLMTIQSGRTSKKGTMLYSAVVVVPKCGEMN